MIEVRHVTKRYGAKKAVDDLSFQVRKGEILGFLGPNGAGKSTTMRIITGFIPPTSGNVRIGGADIGKDALRVRQMMGYLPENAPVYPDMTVFDYLLFCGRIRCLGAGLVMRVEEIIEKCFLITVKRQPVCTLSKGYKQRVCFAQSILHDPQYLIMDEPTDGLDPNQKHEVRQMIQTMGSEKAIILSTHILDEVESICSRAIIISKGRIVADASPFELKKRSPLHGSLCLTLLKGDIQHALGRVQNTPGVKRAELIEGKKGAGIRAFPISPETLIFDPVLTNLLDSGHKVESIYIEEGRLDQVFRTVTRG